MRVGIDGRALRGGRGIARYTSGLLRALADAHPSDEWRVFLAGSERVDLPHPALTVRHDPRPQRTVFGTAALTGRPQLDLLLGEGLDVVWCPSPAPLALSGRTPFLLTVHDLSWELRPDDFTAYERTWHRLARLHRLAARADIIVCNSVATRNVMQERWRDIDPARVRIVPPGIDRPEGDAKVFHRLPGHYFLAVGALEPRKGIDVLVEAFQRARAHGLKADLVLAGTGRLGGAIAGPGVHVLGPVSDEQLSACYSQAIALVMPSWLEGFGLPPLEALAHGTPSIVSDLEVFAETLGPDGALRVPPGDADALARALLVLSRDASLRRALVEAGTRAIEPYTWKAAADGLYRALGDAIAAHGR